MMKEGLWLGVDSYVRGAVRDKAQHTRDEKRVEYVENNAKQGRVSLLGWGTCLIKRDKNHPSSSMTRPQQLLVDYPQYCGRPPKLALLACHSDPPPLA